MIKTLSNKNVLLLCTGFHSYYKNIQEELYRSGVYTVTFFQIPRFPESCRNIFHSRSYFFLYHLLKNPFYRTKWTNQLIERIRNDKFDILLCIGDVPFKEFFLDKLKEMNPEIQTYLFLWDRFSIVYVPKNIIKKFDYKFSFDRDDCKKVEGLEYLPDFYLHSEQTSNTPLKYDVCVIATYLENRAQTALKLKEFCDQNGLKAYIYLLYVEPTVSRWNIIGRMLASRRKERFMKKYGDADFIKRVRLTTEQVDAIQNQSACIFDFSYKGRQGLTLNAVAALVKGKKLITSNYRIKNEDFYNPQTIYVYDFDNPQFDLEFFKRPVAPKQVDNLRLDNWLKYILCR